MDRKNTLFELVRNGNASDLITQLDESNVNVLNNYGQNLLQEAFSTGRYDIAVNLIDLNINIDNADYKGQTALHYLSEHKSLEVVKHLLQHGADFSINDKFGNQPLWTAVFNARGVYDVVHELIINGADPFHKNNAGRAPMDFALQIQDDFLIYLLKKESLSNLVASSGHKKKRQNKIING